VQNFIKLSAAVYDLTCPQCKKNFATMLKTILPSLPRAVFTDRGTCSYLQKAHWAETHKHLELHQIQGEENKLEEDRLTTLDGLTTNATAEDQSQLDISGLKTGPLCR